MHKVMRKSLVNLALGEQNKRNIEDDMNIYELADVLNAQLIVTRYANQENRFSAKFERCETKDGGCLCSEYGNGKTAIEAINAYSNAIKGKTLVFDAMTDKRREFVAPKMEQVIA